MFINRKQHKHLIIKVHNVSSFNTISFACIGCNTNYSKNHKGEEKQHLFLTGHVMMQTKLWDYSYPLL